MPLKQRPLVDTFGHRGKARYVDECTGEVLDTQLIQAALMEEMSYFNDRAWEVDTKEHMATVDGHVFVRSRWVLCSKGDADEPDLRARFVACEINRGDRQDQFFASTPPLEAKKMLAMLRKGHKIIDPCS